MRARREQPHLRDLPTDLRGLDPINAWPWCTVIRVVSPFHTKDMSHGFRAVISIPNFTCGITRSGAYGLRTIGGYLMTGPSGAAGTGCCC